MKAFPTPKLGLAVLLGWVFSLAPAWALTVGWQDHDVNKDGTTEKVAVTNLADIAFSPDGQILGWYPKTVRATDYRGNYDGKLDLVKKNSGLPLPGTLQGFKPESSSFTRANDQDPNSDLIASFSQGDTRIVYNIHPRLLTIDVDIQTPSPTTLSWSGLGGVDNPTTKILLEGNGSPSATGTGKARYVSWQSRPNAGHATVLMPAGNLEVKLTAQNAGGLAEVSIPAGQTRIKVYGGFNELVRFHVEKLRELPGLFSPNIWGTLSLGLIWLMEFGHTLTNNWGLALVVLTIIITLLTWPLRHSQYKSMGEMQKIQPLVEEINKKYKDSTEKRNEAMMKLYQEHKVNPLSGCLPIFIQMPILFLLWKVISNYEFGQGFLWLPDLAIPDPLYILPALYVLAIMGSTWLSSHGNPQLMRQGIILNLVFVWLVLTFPSGVTLYYTLFTILGLGQQWVINKQLGITPNAPKASKPAK